MAVRTNDIVEVICGDDRRARGKVIKVDRKAGKLIVEGVNRVFKHVRRSQRNPQGGRLSKEMPIPISNVMVVCEACQKACRTGYRYRRDGSKERYCKRCGHPLGQTTPPRQAYARSR